MTTTIAEHDLLSPPWVDVEGVINMRDLGGYKCTTGPDDSRGLIVKPLTIFRSGEPSRITEHGRQQLRVLGVTTFFDLRNDAEVADYKSEVPTLEGVEVIKPWQTESNRSFDPLRIAKSLDAKDGDPMELLYMQILEHGGEAYGTVFKHLKDHPNEPCLVHCTAGKDRTGVFSALFFLLLGVSEDDIVNDYTLTSIGLEKVLPAMIARHKKTNPGDFDEAKIKTITASRKETILGFLGRLKAAYPPTVIDGAEVNEVERYLVEKANLTRSDLDVIRKSFLVSAPA